MPIPADILKRCLRSGPLVLDGAMGTELERRGVPCALPLWSAQALRAAPVVVSGIHHEYVGAGANILVANTFRTNPRTLRRTDLYAVGREMNSTAVQLARIAACRDEVIVAASVAPVEDCYSPKLVPEPDELRQEHAQMMDWLRDAEPDMVWIETMGTRREAVAAAAAARDAGFPFVVSLVLRERGSLLGGDDLAETAAELEPLDPLAIGLNCIPPRGMTALLPRLRACTARPLIAYAHLGNRRPICGWSYAQDASPQEYADYARQWLDQGATIIGGCCGTTPAHIRAVRDMLTR